MWFRSQFFEHEGFAQADFESHLRRARWVLQRLSFEETHFSNWLLKGATEEMARLFPVYDSHGAVSKVALQVLQERYREKEDKPKVFGIWNGRLGSDLGASLALAIDGGPLSEEFDLDIGDDSIVPERLGPAASIAEIVAVIARAYTPAYVMAGSHAYHRRAVFRDKPGVNWMLYLPRVLTAQQVPEAAALVAVDDARGRRLGTIVVSVADEVFSADNPRHVEAANHIEIRLVDQDLLPRYADFRR